MSISIGAKLKQNLLIKPINAVANTKVSKYMSKSYLQENVSKIAGISVASILLKDTAKSYLYVKNDLTNERIPKEKRKFIAGLDLAIGVINFLTQILATLTISKKSTQAKLFKLTFGKNFDKVAKVKYKKVLEKSGKIKNMTNKEFDEGFNSFKKASQDIFGILTTLLGVTIIARKVIVTFVSTAIAEYSKTFLYKEEVKNEENKEDKIGKTNEIKNSAKTETKPEKIEKKIILI